MGKKMRKNLLSSSKPYFSSFPVFKLSPSLILSITLVCLSHLLFGYSLTLENVNSSPRSFWKIYSQNLEEGNEKKRLFSGKLSQRLLKVYSNPFTSAYSCRLLPCFVNHPSIKNKHMTALPTFPSHYSILRSPSISTTNLSESLKYTRNNIKWEHSLSLRRQRLASTSNKQSVFSTEEKEDEVDLTNDNYDVIIIGSGIGGLAAASTLNKMGYRVCVLESHVHAGGCAHSFTIQGFHFDSGPSLFSGFSGLKSPNPLKHVLDFTGANQSLNWLTYDTWGISLPYPSSSQPTLTSATIGPTHFQTLLEKFGGPEAKTEWALLMKEMKPLSEAAMALPPAALRPDIGAVRTLWPFMKNLLFTVLPNGPQLQRPFGEIVQKVGIKDKFIINWLNMLCFLLQGMDIDGTATSVMAYMLADWYRPGVVLDYPEGGVGKVIQAMVESVETNHDPLNPTNSKVYLGHHVEKITIDKSTGQVKGVIAEIRKGKDKDGKRKFKRVHFLSKKKQVISNASIWNTEMFLSPELISLEPQNDKILDSKKKNSVKEIQVENNYSKSSALFSSEEANLAKFIFDNKSNNKKTENSLLLQENNSSSFDMQNREKAFASTTVTANSNANKKQSTHLPKPLHSFMHLHLGVKAEGLPQDLENHYAVVDDWDKPITAPGNVIIISIPSLLDSKLAPEGHHTIHVYSAGNEPYEIWEDVERGSYEYHLLKEKRAQEICYKALEKIIPDVKQRLVVEMIGTPKTHEYFLRRERGTYGPSIAFGSNDSYPSSQNLYGIQGLHHCGDSSFPGIGVPAAAASGSLAAVATGLVSVRKHLELVKSIQM